MKKTGKRLGALLLALVMIVSLVPVTALAARVEDDAVEIAAPETAVHEAKPAGAVDAVDVPAQLAEAVPATMYWRHAGPIEEGTYVIYDDARNLHNSGDHTDQCSEPAPNGDMLKPGHSDGNLHLWQIAGNPTDGYTIMGVTNQKYLTATPSGGQLKLLAETETDFASSTTKFSIEPAEGGYTVSYVDDATTDTMYFALKSGRGGWEFSTREHAVQLFRQTTFVPTSDMTLTGPAPWQTETVDKAIDGNTSNIYSSSGTVAEDARYLQINLTGDEARWLSGLGWVNRGNNNGSVTRYEIKASLDGTTWYSIADNRAGAEWVKDSDKWNVVFFGAPVKAQYVQVWGVEAQNNNLACAELRLSVPDTDPTDFYGISGKVVDAEGTAFAGATVTITPSTVASVTTGDGGTFTFTEAFPTGTYTAVVAADDYQTQRVTVTVKDGNVEMEDITLVPMVTSIHGKVLDGETGVVGATVTLATGSDYTVQSLTATTTAGGSYTFSDLSSLNAGTYYVRASKEGHGTMINTETPVVVNDEKKVADVDHNVKLPAFNDTAYQEAGYSIKTFTFGDSEEHPMIINGSTNPQGTATVTDGHLELAFTGHDRQHNLMRLANTPLKNGEVEFDVTRTDGNGCRFGLGLRVGAGKTEGENDFARWIFVGQFASTTAWGYEYWNGDTGTSFWSDDFAGPRFVANETRHIKVKIADMKISLWVDGIAVFEDASLNKKNLTASAGTASFNPPTAAGDAGFLYGGSGADNDGCGEKTDTLTIDNLRVVRFDPAYTVDTAAAVTGGTLSITTNAPGADPVPLPADKRVPEGDVVTVSGTPTNSGYVLDALTLTKTSDGSAVTGVTFTRNDDGSIRFAMPKYNVTVNGKILPKLTEVTIGEANGLKVGKELTTTVKAGETTVTSGVTYEWYHQSTANQEVTESTTWSQCRVGGANEGDSYIASAERELFTNDQGKYVKVVVRGDGETYASSVSVEAVTTAAVAEADVGVASVSLNTGEAAAMEKGGTLAVTATLTSAVSGKVPTTPQSIAWTSSDATVATVAAGSDAKQATITAVSNGEATITVTVTDALGATRNASVTVTVTTAVTGIKVYNGSQDVTGGTIVIYANDSAELTDTGKVNSVNLTAVLEPEGATDITVSWVRPAGNTGGIQLQTSEADSKTITVKVLGADDPSHDISADQFHNYSVTVKPSVEEGEGEDSRAATVTIQVKRLMATAIEIDGTLKNGETLTADIEALMMTDAVKETLTYQWKRTKGGNTTDISGANSKTYTLTDDDVGATISVVVSAAENDQFYEGSVTATTGDTTVAKGDGPNAPTGLTGTAPTGEGAVDGKITGLQSGKSYEYVAKGESDTTAPESGWADLTADTQLATGSYWVRIKGTDYNEVGAAAQVTVPAYNDTRPTIIKGEMTNGTVNVDERATAGTTVTITVDPSTSTGYQLSAGSLTVTTESGETVAVAAVAGQANQYTFTMPNENVTINATFVKQTFTITHNLTNLACHLGTAPSHTVNWGDTTAITIDPTQGYSRPAKSDITVVGADGQELGDTTWSYSPTTGAITITGGVKQDITVTAAGVPAKYNVTYHLTNGLTSSNNDQATYNTPYTTTLSVVTASASTYERPDTITVERGGVRLTVDTDYTYDKTSGAVTIKAAAVTGELSITAVGKVKKTAIERVSITFSHHVGGVEGETPHVGDTLVASVTPSNASVTYQWKRDGVAITTNGTSANYLLVDADENANITVTVTATATGAFSGTETSAAVGPVGAQVVAATGVTISAPAGSNNTVAKGSTLQLTAALTPEGANTNSEVTWTSGTPAVATVANGVVTGVTAGTAVITAALPGGQTADLTVTVTAPVKVTLDGIAQVGQKLTATVSPEGAAVTYAWARVNADNDTVVATLASTTNEYTLVEDDAGFRIKVTVTGTGNLYTGSDAKTSVKVAAADEKPIVDTTNLEEAIETAKAAMEDIETIDGKTVDEVAEGTKFVTTAEMEALETAIAEAEAALADEEKTNESVAAAVTALNGAVTTFNAAVKTGTKPKVDTKVLDDAIAAAKAAAKDVQVKPDDPDPSTVSKGTKYVSAQQVLDDLLGAIATAEAADTTDAAAVEAAADALNEALETFNGEVRTGTKQSSSSSRPSSSTSTVTNPDGSTTTTTTKPDGTKVETTEKPDGTKETVETKRDGTVIETVETPDGTVESVKTQPDGTVVETVVAPDGTKESVMTRPDGTVTETVTDTEGAMTEKVTDPEENVTITVTDPEGEELAKLEIPAEIPEPETKFDDAVDHWAEESINKIAALGLVNGVGDNKYGTESALTRGELATVLYRLSNGKSGYRVSFNDVEIGQYYTEGVAWAAKAKVVTGYTADIFAPNDVITREQLAVMLCRYAKLIGMDTTAKAESLNAFADGANTGAWAVDGVAWCVENGILKGKGNDILDPTSNVTRAQVAVMLDRFLGLIK